MVHEKQCHCLTVTGRKRTVPRLKIISANMKERKEREERKERQTSTGTGAQKP